MLLMYLDLINACPTTSREKERGSSETFSTFNVNPFPQLARNQTISPVSDVALWSVDRWETKQV